MSEEAYVSVLPTCDVCKVNGRPETVAAYDGKTTSGPWANMCHACFAELGVGLGTGRGQRLIVGERPTMSTPEHAAAIQDAMEDGDSDRVWDLVGDGDLADYL